MIALGFAFTQYRTGTFHDKHVHCRDKWDKISMTALSKLKSSLELRRGKEINLLCTILRIQNKYNIISVVGI